MNPALALIEFDSIAAGIEAADAMTKKAPVAQVAAGTVHLGKYLALVAGEVADVEESLMAGLAVGAGAVLDHIFLPGVHPDVVAALAGSRDGRPIVALGIVETATVAAAIQAADAGIKGALVSLLEVRLADGLGGKGLVFYTGEIADVEAAVRCGAESIAGSTLLHTVVIPHLHPEMATLLLSDTRWRPHARTLVT